MTLESSSAVPAAEDDLVIWFVPGPCDDPAVRQRFVAAVREAFDKAEHLGARPQVAGAVDRILSLTPLRPGTVVAVRAGAHPGVFGRPPVVLLLPTRVRGPLLELRSARTRSPRRQSGTG